MHIAILSRGPSLYSTRRLVEAGEERGHDISIVDHAAGSLRIGGGGDRRGEILLRGIPLHLPDVAIPRIGSSITALGAGVTSHFEMLGIPLTTGTEGLLLARDKLRCLQYLAAQGLPVPPTVVATAYQNPWHAIQRLGKFPYVVKMLESTHGIGVDLVHNRLQLERTLESFIRLQGRALIQPFFKEAEGTDIRALVVDGRVVAAMRRRARSGEFRSNLHRGATAEAIELTAEETDIVLRSVDLLGIHVAGVDLLPTQGGPVIMEVNASPGLEGIEQATGVDVAGAVIEVAVRIGLKPQKSNP
ncbi:MAG: RimK family alpha-L-glutamate ligase [Saprospiraceae bacterium]